MVDCIVFEVKGFQEKLYTYEESNSDLINK